MKHNYCVETAHDLLSECFHALGDEASSVKEQAAAQKLARDARMGMVSGSGVGMQLKLSLQLLDDFKCGHCLNDSPRNELKKCSNCRAVRYCRCGS